MRGDGLVVSTVGRNAPAYANIHVNRRVADKETQTTKFDDVRRVRMLTLPRRRELKSMAEETAKQETALQLPGDAVRQSGDPLARAQVLPLRLVLETPIINFTVRMLMELEPGAIVETAAQHNEDLLLHVNGQLVGSVKFDVTRDKLAVRLTGVA